MESCYTSTTILSWSTDKMEITLGAIKNDLHSIKTISKQHADTTFLPNMWGKPDLSAENPIHNWLRSSSYVEGSINGINR